MITTKRQSRDISAVPQAPAIEFEWDDVGGIKAAPPRAMVKGVVIDEGTAQLEIIDEKGAGVVLGVYRTHAPSIEEQVMAVACAIYWGMWRRMWLEDQAAAASASGVANG